MDIQHTHISFGLAISAAKTGLRIARAGWNGKGLFVFAQVPSEVPESVVPKMSSLPPAVKAEFVRRGGPVRYQNQLAIVYPDNNVYGWVASPSDIMANDWFILPDAVWNEDFTPAPVAETVGTARPLP